MPCTSTSRPSWCPRFSRYCPVSPSRSSTRRYHSSLDKVLSKDRWPILASVVDRMPPPLSPWSSSRPAQRFFAASNVLIYLYHAAVIQDLPATEPLLPETPSHRHNFTMAIFMKEMRSIFNILGNRSSATRRSLLLLGLVFFTAAISKATRPLFITYIQHRVDIAPHLVRLDRSPPSSLVLTNTRIYRRSS